jgi:hypothetical protein
MIKNKMTYTEPEEPVVDFTGEGIVRAEQMCPNTRYAKRQATREEARHWKIKYKE